MSLDEQKSLYEQLIEENQKKLKNVTLKDERDHLKHQIENAVSAIKYIESKESIA